MGYQALPSFPGNITCLVHLMIINHLMWFVEFGSLSISD